MERVAGIQTGGSERAFDLYMKTQYLHQHHPGHGVTFATGTPISNTMVELYTVQRFLDPEGLEARSLAHFDAWAATFGEVVDAMELAPDGASLRPRSRFAQFTNLPELQQMFRSYADVQTAAMLDLPRPRLAGDKATVIACPMSDEQQALQEALVARYEAIRSGQVKPWEDNALAITTDGRKLALDARLLSATAPDFPDSKINALVANVTAIWQRTASDTRHPAHLRRSGDQPHTLGVRRVCRTSSPSWCSTASPARTSPRSATPIRTPRSRSCSSRSARGRCASCWAARRRWAPAPTSKQRLVALHHLDAPWKPAEVEQRDGRILRQDNMNEEVAIYRYVTQGSFDAYLWQALETKARFIAQVLTGDSTVRQAEDIGAQELSYAEVKAIASGNPAVLTLAEADATLHRLHILQKHHADEQYLARRQLRALPADITRLERRLAALTQDIATAEAHATEPVTIGTRPYSRHDALEALAARLHALPALVSETRSVPLGLYRGLRFGLVQHPQGAPEVYVEGALRRSCPTRPGRARPARHPERGRTPDRQRGSGARQEPAATSRSPRASSAITKPGWAQALPMPRIWRP